MATYSDNLEFNSEQLLAQIEILESVRDLIVNSKQKYEEYINSQLRPNWTTDAGTKTVNELINFSETDITSFITYLNGRIQNLKEAQVNTVQINQA